MLRLANIRNGLAFPHDGVCMFQSCHGHHVADGYFRIDAMSYRVVIELLRGHPMTIVDGTARNKPLSDALRYGVPTWLMVFNRAICQRRVHVCPWVTPEMVRVAQGSYHKPLVQSIRKLARLYPPLGPLKVGHNVFLENHPLCGVDDKPKELRARLFQ